MKMKMCVHVIDVLNIRKKVTIHVLFSLASSPGHRFTHCSHLLLPRPYVYPIAPPQAMGTLPSTTRQLGAIVKVSTVCCSMGQLLGQSAEMGTHPSMWPGDMERQEPSAEQVCVCVWGYVGMVLR